MAAGLPTYSSDYPIITDQEIKSPAQGQEALGQGFSNFGKTAEEIGQQMNEDESHAMYMKSIANLNQLKTSTNINFISDPQNAAKYAEGFNDLAHTVTNISKVNPKDRENLNNYASNIRDEVDYRAAETTAKQSQLTAAMSHYDTWPTELNAYRQALISGSPQADSMKTAMLSSVRGLFLTGAITRTQAENANKDMLNMVDLAKDLHNLPIHDASAQQYHYATSTGALDHDTTDNTNAPVNGNTQWSVEHHISDLTFQGQLSVLDKGGQLDGDAVSKFSPAQRQHLIQVNDGLRYANSLINSGTPTTQLQAIYDEYGKRGESVLSYSEQQSRRTLGYYLDNLKSGRMMQAMAKTPDGGAIAQNYQARNAALTAKGNPMSPEAINNGLLNNKNNLVTHAVAWGIGHKVPSDQINPIPESDTNAIAAGFSQNGTPQNVITTLNQYNSNNKPWVAESLKDPTQRAVTQIIGMNDNRVSPSEQIDYITANRNGGFGWKENEARQKGDITDSGLKIMAGAALKDQFDLISSGMPPEDAARFRGGLMESVLNLVKYKAIQNKDFNISNASQYVNDASEIVKNSFDVKSGNNFMVNNKNLNFDDQTLEILADYAVGKGYAQAFKGVSAINQLASQSANPLMMTISPTGYLIAKDGHGGTYFKEKITAALMSDAFQQYHESLPTQKAFTPEELEQRRIYLRSQTSRIQ